MLMVWESQEDFLRRLDAPGFTHLATLVEDVSRKPRIEFPMADLRQRADLLHAVDAALKRRRTAADQDEPPRRPRRSTAPRLFTRR